MVTDKRFKAYIGDVFGGFFTNQTIPPRIWIETKCKQTNFREFLVGGIFDHREFNRRGYSTQKIIEGIFDHWEFDGRDHFTRKIVPGHNALWCQNLLKFQLNQ
uniref:Uncharacterized protein n=1 Tax=Romanomermis culicivorax TaxID=13658 RepID=A0A915IJ70_ROMCU